jgi:hypothetical protein
MRNTVISLCDYSGAWSEPYREAGYNVIQVDLKLGTDAILFPSAMSDSPRLPRQFADIGEYIGKVYAVLAAPVCTVFSGSGAKHPRSDDDIRAGLALVDACYRIATVTRAEVFALEQPVGKTRKWIGEPVLRFNPNDYAGLADNPRSEQYTKRTCLYGWFNTELTTDYALPAVDGSKLWRDYGGKSERTKELRSITPQGFSRAFWRANTGELCAHRIGSIS